MQDTMRRSNIYIGPTRRENKQEMRRVIYDFFFLDGRLAGLLAPLAGVDDRDILSALSAFWTSSITRFCSSKHQHTPPPYAHVCQLTFPREELPPLFARISSCSASFSIMPSSVLHRR